MSTYSDPVLLVVAGVAQGPATGQQWEGGTGVLMVSTITSGDFQATIDGGASWIPVDSLASGSALTAAAVGAHPFMLGPCRIRMSAPGVASNVQAVRC